MLLRSISKLVLQEAHVRNIFLRTTQYGDVSCIFKVASAIQSKPARPTELARPAQTYPA